MFISRRNHDYFNLCHSASLPRLKVYALAVRLSNPTAASRERP
jgi:hypothetical protein